MSCATGLPGGGDDGTCRRGEIKAKAQVGKRSDRKTTGNGRIAGDRVNKSNRGKHGRGGENGVRNNGKDDIRNDRKNRDNDSEWFLDVDSNSDNIKDDICNDMKIRDDDSEWFLDVDSDSDNECDSDGSDGPCLSD